MTDNRMFIHDAYRAALADWTNREINGLPHESDLLEVTASLASTFSAQSISLDDVLAALKP
jgi:hypothetical protein